MGFRLLAVGLPGLLALHAGAGRTRGEPLAPSSALHAAGLMQYWQAELPLRRGDSAVSADLVDDYLYVATRLGELHALDASVGLLRWTHSVASRGRRVFKPAHLFTSDGRRAVLVAHSEGAYVYDRDSGAVLADVSEMWPAGSAAVGDAVTFYVGSTDGHVYAVQWYDPKYRQPIQRWRVRAGGPVTSAPVLLGDVLYFASQGGGVFACTADWDKNLRWRYATEAAIVADLHVDESGAYVAGLDRSLYRLDVTTGALLWRYRFPRPLRSAPVVSQRTVYQYCPGSGLSALDVDTRELLWARPSATRFVSRRADRTCVVMEDDRLAVLDSDSGAVRGVVPIPPNSRTATNPDGLTVYVVTPAGGVACFTTSEMRHLRADDIRRGLTPPRESDAAEVGADDQQAAEDIDDAADVDPDDPLRSGTDR